MQGQAALRAPTPRTTPNVSEFGGSGLTVPGGGGSLLFWGGAVSLGRLEPSHVELRRRPMRRFLSLARVGSTFVGTAHGTFLSVSNAEMIPESG